MSPTQLAFHRFRRHVPGVVGVIWVGICALTGLLGYWLAPDATTHANFQVLELAKLPPGSKVELLLLPQPGVEPRGVWERFWGGQVQQHLPVPLSAGTALRLDSPWVKLTKPGGIPDSVRLARLGYAKGERPTMAALQKDHLVSRTYLLGTDSYGRDLWSRIMLGARVSLSVGMMAVLISLLIGLTLGTLAGYFGGWVDRTVMWLVSVLWAIPTLLMALVIAAVMKEKGLWQIYLAIGVSMWVEVARLIRGQILSVREQAFVEAAQSLGLRSGRIMWRHILPNVISPLIVIAVANFGAAVLIESGLSFLGIGVQVPVPTWGRMINEGYTYLMFDKGQWLAIYPGLALVSLIVAVNLVGIGLRDALDVRR
jgi:peptide/nickel transport system permease protein